MTLAAMLWTGGKDSALALDEAVRDSYRIGCLATFAPPEPVFRAHPLAFMELQARALRLPHRLLAVTAPFDAGYEAGLRKLRDEHGIDPCGEQGEYHTLTTRSPEFDRAIEIGDWSVKIEGDLAFMAFAEPHQAQAAAPGR